MKKSNRVILIILIVGFGAFLRFYNLGEASFFNDELETLRVASYGSITEMITEGIIQDVHPPGFQIMMYYVVHYMGNSEFWLRFPATLAGIFAIFMIYILGRYLYSSREGLFAAVLTAVLWAPLYYSQEARAYSFLLLFSIITIFLWLQIVNDLYNENSVKKSLVILFIITAIFMEYFQYLGLLLLVLQGMSAIVVLVKKPKQLLKVILIFIIIFIAFLPWLPYALVQFSHGAKWIQKPKLLAFGYYLATLYNLSPYVLGIAILSSLVFFLKIIKNGFYKHQLFISQDIFLILWLTVPFTVMFVKSIVSQPALTYYSLLISAPAAYILFARGFTVLNVKDKWQNIFAVLIFIYFTWQLIFNMNYYSQPYQDHILVFGKRFHKRTKEMFREAAIYTKEHDKEYKNSLIIANAWFSYYFDYYFNKIGYDRKVDFHVISAKDTIKLMNLYDDYKKDFIWVLRGHIKTDSVFYNWMGNHYELLHHEPMVGADVRLYKIKKIL